MFSIVVEAPYFTAVHDITEGEVFMARLHHMGGGGIIHFLKFVLEFLFKGVWLRLARWA